MVEGKKEKQQGPGIKIGGLDSLLEQLNQLADASGNPEAQQRVATLKERLGTLSREGQKEEPHGESQEEEPRVQGGVDIGGLLGDILGGGRKRDWLPSCR